MARMEIWTGRERRRQWLDEQKLQILDEIARSGSSISKVARRHDLVPQQIYTWRRQLLGKAKAANQEQPPVFLPVSVVAEPKRPGSVAVEKEPKGAGGSSQIEITLAKSGRTLKVAADLDPAVLQALIRTVERHDRAWGECPGLPRLRRYGYAEGDLWPGCLCGKRVAPEAHLWCGLRLPWPARRQDQTADLGRARLLPPLQGTGEGALSLAVGCGWHGAADQRPAGHVMGGHGLASPFLVLAAPKNRIDQLPADRQIGDKGL